MGARNKTDTGAFEDNDHRKQKRVSEILRNGRIVKDQELKDVSDSLRIRLPFLEAIEAGRYEELPGTTYAIGFVRAYAEYLGLDNKAIVEQFKIEAAELARRTELHFPEPLPGGRVPGGAIVFVCIILAVVFYGAWMLVSSNGKSVAEVVSELPTNLAEMIGLDVSKDDDEKMGAVEDKTASTPSNETTETSVMEVVETPVTKDASGIATVDNEPVANTLSASEELTPAPETVAEVVEVIEETPIAENIANEPPLAAAAEIATQTESVVTQATQAIESVNDEVEVTSMDDAANTNIDVDTPEIVAEEIVADVVEETANAAVETEQVATVNPVVSDPIPSPPTLPQVERLPKVYGEDNVNARVIITANTPTWVEISAPSGELILTRLLGTKDSFRVPNTQGLTLVTGNAGGLDFTVDGQAVPAIGAIGSVRRDVSLDAESLKKGQN